MLRLNGQQYGEAVATCNTALAMKALDAGGTLDFDQIVRCVIDSLGEDFDVEPMETWPDDDYEMTPWQQNMIDRVIAASERGERVVLSPPPPHGGRRPRPTDLEQRAVEAALAVSPKPSGTVTSPTKIL